MADDDGGSDNNDNYNEMLMISSTSNIVKADEMMSNRLTRPPCWSDPGGLLVTTKLSPSSILESTSKTKVSKVNLETKKARQEKMTTLLKFENHMK